MSKVVAICFEDLERRAAVLEKITETITEEVLVVLVSIKSLQTLKGLTCEER